MWTELAGCACVLAYLLALLLILGLFGINRLRDDEGEGGGG